MITPSNGIYDCIGGFQIVNGMCNNITGCLIPIMVSGVRECQLCDGRYYDPNPTAGACGCYDNST